MKRVARLRRRLELYWLTQDEGHKDREFISLCGRSQDQLAFLCQVPPRGQLVRLNPIPLHLRIHGHASVFATTCTFISHGQRQCPDA